MTSNGSSAAIPANGHAVQLRTELPHASRVVMPASASRRRASSTWAVSTKWNWTFWRVVTWPLPPPPQRSATVGERVELGRGRDAAGQLGPDHHDPVLALAVDAVDQAERAPVVGRQVAALERLEALDEEIDVGLPGEAGAAGGGAAAASAAAAVAWFDRGHGVLPRASASRRRGAVARASSARAAGCVGERDDRADDEEAGQLGRERRRRRARRGCRSRSPRRRATRPGRPRPGSRRPSRARPGTRAIAARAARPISTTTVDRAGREAAEDRRVGRARRGR